MTINQKMLKRINIMRWAARIWSILAFVFGVILLVSVLKEQQVEPQSSIYWLLFGLWFASLLGLLAGWRWEMAGGVIALTSLISRELMVYFFSGQVLVGFWMVWLPILPPAVLFMETWRLENKLKESQYPCEVFD
ncbi:MAG: hypothetical protein RQ728_00315 [Brevefilum sp.]|nr:hypothetical protein [Brevefilum sp.]MDT8380680.1 hypothetical protein [Brevefilum sp.]